MKGMKAGKAKKMGSTKGQSPTRGIMMQPLTGTMKSQKLRRTGGKSGRIAYTNL